MVAPPVESKVIKLDQDLNAVDGEIWQIVWITWTPYQAVYSFVYIYLITDIRWGGGGGRYHDNYHQIYPASNNLKLG